MSTAQILHTSSDRSVLTYRADTLMFENENFLGSLFLLDSWRGMLVLNLSHFHFLFCIFSVEPNFLCAVSVSSGATTLFMPKFPESYEVWMGK